MPNRVSEWKPGDPCGQCGSKLTVWRKDGTSVYGHCNSCDADDEDE